MKKLIIALMLFAPVAVFAQKFAHVDTESVLKSYYEVSRINRALEKMFKQKEDELRTMQVKLQRKADEYDKKKATMTAGVQKETEDALQEEYKQLEQAYTKYQQEMQAKQKEMLEPVYRNVKEAIRIVGEEGDYTYIFEHDAALYVGASSKDVTTRVKDVLTRSQFIIPDKYFK